MSQTPIFCRENYFKYMCSGQIIKLRKALVSRNLVN